MRLNVRNIGILAHVDAGKTTLTEQLLYKSEVIKELGSVDRGTAHTDNLEIEQLRGISVKSTEINLSWKGMNINIIDTPGHVDFVGEVERSLGVLDGAVIVISSVEGVQPQTEVYFNALKQMKIPTIIFINKVDRIGGDVNQVQREIEKVLTKAALPLEQLTGEATSLPKLEYFNNSNEGLKTSIIEKLADKDEKLLTKYLDGVEITIEDINQSLKQQVKIGELYPIVYGSAIKGIGIYELLDLLVKVLPELPDLSAEELSGLVFKIKTDKTMGKMAFVKLYSGKIESRDDIYNHTKDVHEKVTQIKKLVGYKEMNFTEAVAGEIAWVSGLSNASIGDVMGSPSRVPRVPEITKPLLTVQVYPNKKDEFVKLAQALQELEEEDPLLNVNWIKDKHEVHIQIIGMIQLEIIENLLQTRYGIGVSFGKSSVIYKETPSSWSLGFEAYTMPKPCWAIVKFEVEPLPYGSGLVYESRIRTEDIKPRYQREIEHQLPITLKQGLYGWEVIDLKVTLIAGEDHVMHSNPGDFLIATSMGIMNGLKNTGTTLLEPILNFRISVPEKVSGKVLNDIVQMRGSFDSPVVINGIFTVEGKMPAATSIEYGVRLGIISSGKGVMSTRLSSYNPVPLELGAIRERFGVNPLDRAKYILYARNAIN